MATAIPKQLPDDRRVAETQWARWSASMTAGFHTPPQCTVGKFFERKWHLIASDIGHEDAKWGVINSQISYQIRNPEKKQF